MYRVSIYILSKRYFGTAGRHFLISFAPFHPVLMLFSFLRISICYNKVKILLLQVIYFISSSLASSFRSFVNGATVYCGVNGTLVC